MQGMPCCRLAGTQAPTLPDSSRVCARTGGGPVPFAARQGGRAGKARRGAACRKEKAMAAPARHGAEGAAQGSCRLSAVVAVRFLPCLTVTALPPPCGRPPRGGPASTPGPREQETGLRQSLSGPQNVKSADPNGRRPARRKRDSLRENRGESLVSGGEARKPVPPEEFCDITASC